MSLSEPQPDPQRPQDPRDSTQPDAQPEPRDETVIGTVTGTLHRAPRYTNFMILGAILGVLSALVLTVIFPENAEFSRAQVFGFLLLAGVAGGVALGSVIALILDKVVGRRTTTVVADRLGRSESRADEAPGS
ncbi:hypothetical protein [Cryobacterium melibiosiphilum]|uniref:hypothetical protein n=1 Tax=Cryobacterium melibiosiphilum TaxID=995039 RepID=UPI001F2A4A10|nr:hypothetical protein [Cryobacterium melibiosiphilum]